MGQLFSGMFPSLQDALSDKSDPLIPPVTFVIFGATGDLTRRKLVPALYNLVRDRVFDERLRVVGVARSEVGLDDFKSVQKQGVADFSRSGVDDATWEMLSAAMQYYRMDYDSGADYLGLRQFLGMDLPENRDRLYLFYLSVPPASFEMIVTGLGQQKVIRPMHHGHKPRVRVVFEKPFGRDLSSAERLNRVASAFLDESQMFRMDHYLGKETVQNLMVFRFANAIFEPLWNRRYIREVRIRAYETIGIEGRGRFYEETGVIRDVFQNHLLQILALTAMESCASFSAERIRDERAKLLDSIRRLDADRLSGDVVLGQYAGYRQEANVNSDSRVPTFIKARLFVDNWRWQGVPFYLSCGKRMGVKATEVEIEYNPVPLCLFEQGETCQRLAPNVLVIRIQPNEGISLKIGAKAPGDALDVSEVEMQFDFSTSFGANAQQEAYEKMVIDCIRGNQTLFARQDEVMAMWTLVAPLLEGIVDGRLDVQSYEDGEELKIGSPHGAP